MLNYLIPCCTHLIGCRLAAHRAAHYHQTVPHQHHLVYLHYFFQIPRRCLQISLRQINAQPLDYVIAYWLEGAADRRWLSRCRRPDRSVVKWQRKTGVNEIWKICNEICEQKNEAKPVEWAFHYGRPQRVATDALHSWWQEEPNTK